MTSSCIQYKPAVKRVTSQTKSTYQAYTGCLLKFWLHMYHLFGEKRRHHSLPEQQGYYVCLIPFTGRKQNHDCLTNVTDVLNNLLHEQAKGFLKRYKGHPETLSEMSIAASIHPADTVKKAATTHIS